MGVTLTPPGGAQPQGRPPSFTESPTAVGVAAQAPPPRPPAPAPAPPGPFQQNLTRALNTVSGDVNQFLGPLSFLSPVPGDIPEAGGMLGGLGGALLTRNPLLGPVWSTLGAGLGAAGGALATGEDPLARGTQSGVGQAIGETAAFLPRQVVMGRAARGPLQAREQQIAANQERYTTGVERATQLRKEQAYQSKLAHQAAVGRQGLQHEAALAQHARTADQMAEGAATQIAEAYKAQVPAWRDQPSSTKGLAEMVYGKGPQLLSADYDKAMQAAMAKAKGQKIDLPMDAALQLGLPIPPDVVARFGVRQGPGVGIPAPPEVQALVGAPSPGGAFYESFPVDAEIVMRAAQGKALKAPGAYRAVVNALDAADITDPAARAAYKAGMSLIEFTDKSRMLGPRGDRFEFDKALEGLAKLSKLEALRKRGMGDIYQGPIPAAARGADPGAAPAAPGKIPPPVTPPLRLPPKPPDVPMPENVSQTVILPSLAQHPWATGGALSAAGHALGLPYGLGYGLAAAIPGSKITTKAPVNPVLETILRTAPGLIGQEAVHPEKKKRDAR